MRLTLWMFLTVLFISCNLKPNEKRFLKTRSALSEKDILSVLDNSAKDGSAGFISLGHPYSHLIDSRINLFKGSENEWAIAVERLGYNPRSGLILLEVYYYGNCLKNLKVRINSDCGYNTYEPIDKSSFLNSITEEETIKSKSDPWIVRGKSVAIKYTRQELLENEIENDTARKDLGIEAVARLAVKQHPNIFRATDEELYYSIPKNVKKLLVLDRWYHKDFYLLPMENEVPDYKKKNQEVWLKDRPGSYETWRQIAKVLVSGDTSFYKPTSEANNHWKNWPESGSL